VLLVFDVEFKIGDLTVLHLDLALNSGQLVVVLVPHIDLVADLLIELLNLPLYIVLALFDLLNL
jgi:hypothetical protein